MYGQRMNEQVKRGLVALILGIALYLVSLLVAGGGDSAVTPFRLGGILAGIAGVVLLCQGLLSHDRD